MKADLTLYSYWRSTTSYRVRIALHLKGLAYETIPVDLVAGDQKQAGYAGLNPIKGVPTLKVSPGEYLTQSLAIIEWLEETHPSQPLLPADPLLRSKHRAAALVVATDIHPVNNLKVVNRIKSIGHTEKEARNWMCHWMVEGLRAFTALIDKGTPFCFGKMPGIADIHLVPQLYNARRWGVDLKPFTRLTEIEARCLGLAAFDAAKPENQPDAIDVKETV